MYQQNEEVRSKLHNTVYVLHDCTYLNCLKSFLTLPDLITHIEQEHLDLSSSKIDQLARENLESLPMSYILRFSDESAPPPRYVHKNEHLYRSNNSLFQSSHNNNNLEFKDKRDGSGGSRRSSSTKDEILSIIQHKPYTTDMSHKKPYGCNMPGCQKRFKNVNGIKYHYKNYHKVYQHSPALKRSVLKSKVVKQSNENKTVKKNNDWSIFSSDFTTFNTLMDLFIKNNGEDVGNKENRFFLNAGNSSTSIPCSNSNEYSVFDALNLNMIIEN